MLKKGEKRVWPNWPSLCLRKNLRQKTRDLHRVQDKDGKTYVEGLRFSPSR